MEFLDEDARPRVLFQSRAPTSSDSSPPIFNHHQLNKPLILVTSSISFLLFAFTLFTSQPEPLNSLLLWLALSFLIGPFAPSFMTGGDIRVGEGPVLEFPDPETLVDDDAKKRSSQKRSKPRRSEDIIVASTIPVVGSEDKKKNRDDKSADVVVVQEEEEKEWTDGDVELLRKNLLKHPAGKPRRWEIIADSLRGRHKVESVIRKSKELGEKKLDDSDSYAVFLKNRKPLSKKIEGFSEEVDRNTENEKDLLGGGSVSWTAAEDIALLNALKAFPKDVSMRWEKIATAVPGKPKGACIKRVSELKKGFRMSKASTEG